MTFQEALNGSAADRVHWKWERMKEAEQMARIYAASPEVADGWRKEAARYRAMITPLK